MLKDQNYQQQQQQQQQPKLTLNSLLEEYVFGWTLEIKLQTNHLYS